MSRKNYPSNALPLNDARHFQFFWFAAIKCDAECIRKLLRFKPRNHNEGIQYARVLFIGFRCKDH